MPWYAFAAFPFLAMHKPNLLTWSVTGLTASTAYQVRVRYRDRNSSIAVDGPGVQFTGADGWSEWSTPVMFNMNTRRGTVTFTLTS